MTPKPFRMVRAAALWIPLLAVGLVACATTSGPLERSVASGADATAEATEESTDGGVLPGDRIRLGIWNEPLMSDTFHVDERGDVVLPKLGAVSVRGMSPQGVRDRVREDYGEYLRNPAVEVTVLRRIGVHGEVKEPTVYWLDVTMTVQDAIALAGGITPEGHEDDVTLVRDGRSIALDAEAGDPLVDAGLRSGDQIVVGRKSWFRLNAPVVLSTGVSLASLVTTVILSR